MQNEFKWDVDSLTRILNTREAFVWPYQAEYDVRSQTEIIDWLEQNCKGEYRIHSGFSRRISFKEEEDYTLFLLTWC